MVSWNELFDVFKKLLALPKKSREEQAASYASALLDCDLEELKLLDMAFADNVNWIFSGYRAKGLSQACANPKLKVILKKLFVLEVPEELNYLADGEVIAEKTGEHGGLNWKRTSKIIRIRKNGIMNWGTDNTVYKAEQENGMQYAEPVILIPGTDLTRNIVFFNSPKLVRVLTTYCKLYRKSGLKIISNVPVPFWGWLFRFAAAAVKNEEERECFTHTTRVKCNVFLVKRSTLVRNKWKTAKAPRHPVEE